MEFGEWVQLIRKEREFDVRAFAEKTGVDPSTISRIENLKTEATFYTAFRVCEAMDVSPTDLFHALTGRPLHSLAKKSLKEKSKSHIVTLQEVEKFVNDFVSNKNEVCARIAEDLNNLNYFLPRVSSLRRIRERDAAGFEMTPFTSGDSDRLLFTSPLYYRLDLKYPSDIRADDLLFTFEQNGALLLRDVETYLYKLDPEDRLSFDVFGRELASPSIERIKLSDVLKLDVKSKQDGTVIGMYWEACKFYDRFTTYKWHVGYSQLTFFDLPRRSNFEQLPKRSNFEQL